ncbi:hypothetical protein Q8F55_000014 [Vanrija albida]|uniref:PiggyBac transposable element-derived protein domain-containing protein n=1 Tax=Vanrija albida TaxID=181172 RepID=A0ABR3QC05_9TREE
MDMIIGYSDIDTLIKMRTLSSQYRTHIDGILLKHVAIVRNHHRRDDFQNERQMAYIPPITTRLPPLEWGRSLPVAPEVVEIVDIDDMPPPSISYLMPDWGYPRPLDHTAVHTMRRMGSFVTEEEANFFHQVTTTVDFLDLSSQWRHQERLGGARSTIFLPRSGTRYILHLKWSFLSDPFTPWKFLDFHYTTEVKHWVQTNQNQTNENIMRSDSFRGIFKQMKNIARKRGSSLTIVGADGVQPRQFGVRTQEEVLKVMTNAVARGGKKPAHLEFLTLDEWWATLGKKKEVEGMWPVPRRHFKCSDCPKAIPEFSTRCEKCAMVARARRKL